MCLADASGNPSSGLIIRTEVTPRRRFDVVESSPRRVVGRHHFWEATDVQRACIRSCYLPKLTHSSLLDCCCSPVNQFWCLRTAEKTGIDTIPPEVGVIAAALVADPEQV
jgi:hypothetical protein